ncbi:MAG TPA: glycoside hydrolase family 99 protein [Symbiobacteriaceae bacterium]|nr:glycoside hydrolase family 99 protein [Symbiobacteriaceae bacterium]
MNEQLLSKRRLLMVIAAIAVTLLGTVGCTAQKQPDPAPGAETRVQIFYYPWYGTPDREPGWIHWTQNGHTPPGDIGAHYYPQLGPYSSSDPHVLDQHMIWLKQARVGVLVTSWWGPGSREDAMTPAVLDAAAEHGLKVAFHLETYRGRTAESVKRDIQYIYGHYGGHPAFFRTARPTHWGPSPAPRGVFYVFESLHVPDADWKGMLDSLRNTSDDAIVLGQTSDVTRLDTCHFDGLYTYDALGYDGSTFPKLQAAITAKNAIFAPSIGPGYIDIRAVAGSTRNKPRADGATYDRMWQSVAEAAAEWVSITSFNEWHEGSQIEPAVPRAEAGFTYLNYDGAYGKRGAEASLAYIDRTAYWVAKFLGR